MLSVLGTSLRMRFERAGDPRDLDAAIDAGEQAVAAVPPGHPGRAGRLSDLQNSLRTRYQHHGNSADLDAAINAGEQAVAASPPGHPDRAMYLSNLAYSQFARFEQTQSTAYLDTAIGYGRQAVAAMPRDHPARADYLSGLAGTLGTRFEHAGDVADVNEAIDCMQQASHASNAAPRTRLAAARNWGAAAAVNGRIHQASEGFAAAVGLLPMVAWHGLDRPTRQEQLVQWAGLAADAAACQIRDGHPEYAVELLEQGRSILWTQALNLRTDFGRLAEAHPALADRLSGLRTILDTPLPEALEQLPEPAGGRALGGKQQQDAIELRKRTAREWDAALTQVRGFKGFQHFLAATPYPELSDIVGSRTLVVVNVSHYGCHALVVAPGADRPQVVDLPGMSMDAAVDHVNQMLRVVAGNAGLGRGFRERERDRHAVLDVLDWAWEAIAEPVLTALGHTSPHETGDRWPRIWWCPTGPLTVLPIHAAGHHPRHRVKTGSTETVLDRVISSYTPTLTALARSREPAASAAVRHLAVGVPASPGHSPLPAVPAELEVLARHFPVGPGNLQLLGSLASRAKVLAAIPDHAWVHLACHAGQVHSDPDHSGFALWDGTLTITDLAALPTQSRDLAFLSACQTATGSTRHLDEAIHLAAAVQFLGYRHVIATMWTIADSPAPYMADKVYTALTQRGTPDSHRSAEALHQATHALRNTDPTNPLLWAPYIHLGP